MKARNMSQPRLAKNSQPKWLLINFILKSQKDQEVAFLASCEATTLPSLNCSA